MQPVLFELPVVGLPVRMFGLFVIAAFFIATLWAQWQVTRLSKPEAAADEKIARMFRMVLAGTLITRILQ